MNFTEEEIKIAKKTRDVIISEGISELRAIYMAGEICMWDELQQVRTNSPEQLLPIIDGSTPHVCPVCCGRQYAPMGFYDRPMSTAINTELCRTCGGTGIVWRHEIDRLERKEEPK